PARTVIGTYTAPTPICITRNMSPTFFSTMATRLSSVNDVDRGSEHRIKRCTGRTRRSPAHDPADKPYGKERPGQFLWLGLDGGDGSGVLSDLCALLGHRGLWTGRLLHHPPVHADPLRPGAQYCPEP